MYVNITTSNKKLCLLILNLRLNSGEGPQFIQAAAIKKPTNVDISKNQKEAKPFAQSSLSPLVNLP